MMRDNVKKQITPMLANCIMTPKGATRSAQARTSSQDAHQSESSHTRVSLAAIQLMATYYYSPPSGPRLMVPG